MSTIRHSYRGILFIDISPAFSNSKAVGDNGFLKASTLDLHSTAKSGSGCSRLLAVKSLIGISKNSPSICPGYFLLSDTLPRLLSQQEAVVQWKSRRHEPFCNHVTRDGKTKSATVDGHSPRPYEWKLHGRTRAGERTLNVFMLNNEEEEYN